MKQTPPYLNGYDVIVSYGQIDTFAAGQRQI